MITMTAKTIDTTQRVKKAANTASFKNLGHAAASIRRAAIKSIKTGKGSSKPGEPPRTRGRRRLPRSIFFATDRDRLSTVIGPLHSRMGVSAEAHEFGKKYLGTRFPARPFMGPALDENASRLPSFWLHTVGS